MLRYCGIYFIRPELVSLLNERREQRNRLPEELRLLLCSFLHSLF
jgi:hypothetical protein